MITLMSSFCQGVWDTERVKEEVAAMMADLQLLDKRNILANKLSGGMKRKLRYRERKTLHQIIVQITCT